MYKSGKSSRNSNLKYTAAGFLSSLLLVFGFGYSNAEPSESIKLPEPRYRSNVSIEEALLYRRSVRDYWEAPLELVEISQLLWAAQGVTDKEGHRTAPSAGALYPLDIYLVVRNVNSLAAGTYKYKPEGHELEKVMTENKWTGLCEAANNQACVKTCAALIGICAVYERSTVKYGERGVRYTHIEVGHAAQNIYLQAVSLNLGTVFVGGYDDRKVQKAMNLPDNEIPLCLMPVGRK